MLELAQVLVSACVEDISSRELPARARKERTLTLGFMVGELFSFQARGKGESVKRVVI